MGTGGCNQNISDPSIRLHLWQQMVLPVVSYGSEVWGVQHPLAFDPDYLDRNSCEGIQLQFLRWYLGARTSTNKHILLHAAHQLPLLQHWLRRTAKFWNKLATADAATWLAHRAFMASVALWRSGNDQCWAAHAVAHLNHLSAVDISAPQMWTVQLDPSDIIASMDSKFAAIMQIHSQSR